MAAFPSWTRIFFKNATAPTGWTKDTNDTYDHGLRIVSGYLGSSTTTNQVSSSPWSSTMTNTTFSMAAGAISPISTNPAIQDVPPHTHTTGGTRYDYPSPLSPIAAQTLAYFNTMTTNPTYAAQPFTLSTPSTGAAGTANGIHSHTVTFTAPFTTLPNNTNFNVKYTDLILAYKTPTGSKTYTAFLDSGKTSLNEGENFSIYVDTSMNVPLGKKFIYNIIPITATSNDFYGPLSGTITTTFDFGTLRRGIAELAGRTVPYYATTGSKYFKYEIIDTAIGSTVFMSTLIEIKDYYNEWSISPTGNFAYVGANEGETLTFDYYLAPGSSLTGYWRIKHGGTGGVPTNASDFVGATSGSVGPKANINDGNTYSITIQVSNDLVTEFGGEDFAIECSDTSNFAVIRSTTPNFHINDTSKLITVTLVNPITTVNEGQLVTYTVNSIGADDGTVLYWNLRETNFNDFDVTSGSFTVSVNPNTGVGTGSFSFNTIADSLTEGPTSFKFDIRLYTILTGPIVATSPLIDLLDTSLAPTFSWVTVPTSVNENTDTTVTFNVANFPVGSNLTYQITNGGVPNTTPPTQNSDFKSMSGTITTTGTNTSSTGSLSIGTEYGTRDTGARSFKLNVIRSDTSATVLTQNITLNDNLREPQGQIEFTRITAGGTFVNTNGIRYNNTSDGPYYTFTWTVPSGVYSISTVCIGGPGGYASVGGGGGGGALCYRNNVNVNPGDVLTVHVGSYGSFGHSGTPTTAQSGGHSLVQTSAGIVAFASGGQGGYGNPSYTVGGPGGLTQAVLLQSDKTGTLVTNMSTTTTTIIITMPTGIPSEIMSWDATGTIIIDSEWIAYSIRGVNGANQAYLVLSTRGKVQFTSGPGAASHSPGAKVRYFPGSMFQGGQGRGGTSTTRGTQGGTGQYNAVGGTGSGIGQTTLQTGGAAWGSAGGVNGGGAVRIIWGGYYRAYPGTNVSNV